MKSEDGSNQAGDSRADAQQDGSASGAPPSFGMSAATSTSTLSARPPMASEPETVAPETVAPVAVAPVAPVALEAAEAEPTVGWYASAPASPVPVAASYNAANPYGTAGPYAAAGPYASAGETHRRAAGGNSRGKLLNAALFGVAPLVLAGIVVVAFVLSSSGKGQTASHTAFRAGAGPSSGQQQPQGTGNTTAGTTPSQPSANHGKRSSNGAFTEPTLDPKSVPGLTVPDPNQKSAAKPRAKPKPKPAGPVTPHNLGAPNFNGYCQHIGNGTAVTTASNAYGWHCSLNPSLPLSIQNACAWTFGLNASKVINLSTNYYDVNSWQCWRTNGVLGQLNISTYCNAAGLGAAKLSARNAYGWSCTGQANIDTIAACQLVYHNNQAFSRFAVFADPYSWQCWH